MLLIQILLFVSSYSTLHRQNDQYYYLKTQSLSSRFSAQLAGFRKIALKISSASYTSSLKKFESDPSPYRMLKISEELKAIADTNYLASGVGIYYPRQDVALNSSVYYTLDTLCIRLGGKRSRRPAEGGGGPFRALFRRDLPGVFSVQQRPDGADADHPSREAQPLRRL